jgi:DNA modification methylase
MDELIQKINQHKQKISKLQIQLAEKEKSLYPAQVYGQKITDKWSMYQGDCIETIKGIPSESIGYSIFSPPFLSLFVYSNAFEDMGNSINDDQFYTHFEYLLPELLRVLKPGRLVSVHCSIVPLTLTHDGVMGIKDFPGALVNLFQKHGFIYHSKVVIWKDPLIQAVRTKMLALAHKQISKDSSRTAQGFADEILTFRKPGVNTEPISHGRGFEEYIGEMKEPKESKNDSAKLNKYSHEVWQRYASPVWFDIRQTNTLNIAVARDSKDEKHICPLQLDAIARCLELWSNPGDIVLSPFAGIGSEGYEAVARNRKFIGIELKESYYKTACNNLRLAEKKQNKLIE